MELYQFAKLDICVILCLLAGSLGAYYTAPALNDWYPQLEKPDFTPPSWLFSPVWIALFVMMGISLYLVWEQNSQSEANYAIALFGAQLVLNFLWSIAFFGMRSPLYGLIVIAMLLLAIAATILAFRRFSTRAALLLVPYLLWTAFAALLNYEVWRLN